MKKNVNVNAKLISMTGLMMAMVFVITRFIQIPIPLGYFNIGNSVILLMCLIVPSPYSIIAASVGSAFADLVSYPIYTVPTLLIKALMPFLFYVILNAFKGKKFGVVVATAVSTLIPLFGYTITGGIIYNDIVAGIAQFPGLFLEYVANLIIITVLYKPITRVNFIK